MSDYNKVQKYEDFNFPVDEKLFDDTENEISETQKQNHGLHYSERKSPHSAEAMIRLLRIIFREVDERKKNRED